MLRVLAAMSVVLTSSPPTGSTAGANAGADVYAGTPRAFLREANAAASRGDWNAVIEICTAWESTAPRDPMPSLCVAQALKSVRRFQEAVAAARRSIALKDGPVAHFNLGVAQYGLGDLAAARDQLARSVALEPKDGNSHRMPGNALAALGEYGAALDVASVEVLNLRSHGRESAVRIQPRVLRRNASPREARR